MNVQAEEKGEGRGRRRRKITPRWSQTVAERTEGRRPGPAAPAAPEPRRGTDQCRAGLGGENKGTLGRPRQPGTRRAEPGSGAEGKGRLSPASHPGYFLPAAFLSPKKPFPNGKALSDTPSPPLTRLASYLPFPKTASCKWPWEDPRQAWSPRNSLLQKEGEFLPLFIYIYRKEIVLLKTVQEQFGNMVNSLEVQSIFSTQSKRRL